MRITDAGNRSIVPLGYAIHQAHQTGMWDERADFPFGNRDIANRFLTFHASSESVRN